MILRVLYILFTLFVVLARTPRYIHGYGHGYIVSFLIGPQLCLLHCIYSVSIPVFYMLFPPTVPEREELVEKDWMGVSRPKKSAIRGLKAENSIRDVIFELVMILTCCLV